MTTRRSSSAWPRASKPRTRTWWAGSPRIAPARRTGRSCTWTPAAPRRAGSLELHELRQRFFDQDGGEARPVGRTDSAVFCAFGRRQPQQGGGRIGSKPVGAENAAPQVAGAQGIGAGRGKASRGSALQVGKDDVGDERGQVVLGLAEGGVVQVHQADPVRAED